MVSSVLTDATIIRGGNVVGTGSSIMRDGIHECVMILMRQTGYFCLREFVLGALHGPYWQNLLFLFFLDR